MTKPTKPADIASAPPFPDRLTDSRTQFATKTANSLQWQGETLTPYFGTLLTYVGDSNDYMEQSLIDADQAVTDAQEKVTLAANQVALAADEADRAEAAADNAAAQANFIGLWENQTGSASPPVSVRHEGQYWQLLVPLADITSVEPGTDINTWLPMVETSVDIGQIVYSFRDLTASGIFVEPGMTYLQSVFPELFDIVGIGSAPPVSKIPDLSTPPPSSPLDIAVSETADYVGIVSGGVVNNYSRSGDALTQLPAASPAPSSTAVRVGMSLDGALQGVGQLGAPYLEFYQRTGSNFNKLTNPATLPTDRVDAVAFDRTGAYVFVSAENPSGDNVFVYEVSGSTVTLADSFNTTLIADADWHPTLDYVATVGSNGSGTAIKLYSSASGVLTSEQTFPDTNVPEFCRWSPTGSYLVTSGQNGVVRVFSFDGSALTEISQPNIPLAGTPGTKGVGVTSDEKFLVVGLASSPYYRVFEFNDGVIGAGYTPSSAPSNQTRNIAVARSAPYTFVASTAASYLWQYKSDYPFDIGTEFYVPDVDALTPQQIGDWVPGVQGKPYVRAK